MGSSDKKGASRRSRGSDHEPTPSVSRRETLYARLPAEPAPAGAPVDDVMIEIGRAHAPHRPADDFLTGLEDDPFAILY